MGLSAKLPNLELLEYKVREYLVQDKTFMDRLTALTEASGCHKYVDLRFHMFWQMWGNTSGGFEGIGGCAMTAEYTTVVHEVNTGYYIVCFGNKPCYLIDEPNEAFLEDLKNHDIKGLNSAKSIYDKKDDHSKEVGRLSMKPSDDTDDKKRKLYASDFALGSLGTVRARYVGKSKYLEYGKIYNVGFDPNTYMCVVRAGDNPGMKSNQGVRFGLSTFEKVDD